MTDKAERSGSSTPPVSAEDATESLPSADEAFVPPGLSNTAGSASVGWQRNWAWMVESDASFVPPSGYRVVAVDTESCAKVRDLTSLRRDLEIAKLFAEAYAARASSRPVGERYADDALWMSALVLYGRAFGSSVRTSERLSDDWLSDGERDTHRFLLDVRDKFIAHAVNNFEHAVVIAYLTNSAFEPRQVSRLGQMHAEIVPLSEDQLVGMIGLCKRYTAHINRRRRAALGEVSRELDALGLDVVYKMPDLVPPEIDVTRVAKRRK